jgi:hypothetical protein
MCRVMRPADQAAMIGAVQMAQQFALRLAGLSLQAQPKLRQPGHLTAGQTQGELLGHLDRADHGGLVGWAHDAAHPGAPVCLEVRVGGMAAGALIAGTLIADMHRPDLGRDGRPPNCGFCWHPPAALARAQCLLISLHRVGDGEMLPGCPVLLPSRATPPALLDSAMAALAPDGGALAGVVAVGLASAAG